jgi:hypothetical protein
MPNKKKVTCSVKTSLSRWNLSSGLSSKDVLLSVLAADFLLALAAVKENLVGQFYLLLWFNVYSPWLILDTWSTKALSEKKRAATKMSIYHVSFYKYNGLFLLVTKFTPGNLSSNFARSIIMSISFYHGIFILVTNFTPINLSSNLCHSAQC